MKYSSKSKELNDALDFVLSFMCDFLPEGWEIHIDVRYEDAEMKLSDPDGNDVSADWDCDDLTVLRMVNEARKMCGLPSV